MRLKCQKVYLKNNKEYWLIVDVKRVKGRNVYTGQKVNQLGHLGPLTEFLYKRNTYVLAKDCKVKIHVVVPKADKQKLRFNLIVENAKAELALFREKKEKYASDINRRIGEFAHASISQWNSEKNSEYTIEDFAIALGEDKKKVYQAVLKLYTSDTAPTKKSIKKASDRTITACMANCEKYWSSLYGFYKPLNAVLEAEFKMYTAEYQRRLKETHV